MEAKRFTIYFTSDLHGYIYPTDYRSREERDMGLFKCASQFRKDGNTLVIDGGDILQGSPLGAFCHDTLGNAGRLAEMMFPATSSPLLVGLLVCTAVPDQASRQATMNAASSCHSQVFGAEA